jgi:hypothetical protein
MLSYIWVSVGSAISRAARFWISGIVVVQRSICGGSVTLEKARVIHYRVNVELNG